MGFFSTFCNRVGSAISSAYHKTKAVVSKAVGWMAEKAEGFVGSVTQMWSRIKPYLGYARKFLKVVGKRTPWPWLTLAFQGIDKALAWLEKVDKHSFVSKVNDALNWLIEKCKNIHAENKEKNLLEEARRHGEILHSAEGKLFGTGDDFYNISAMALLNDYFIARDEVFHAVESDDLQDFEHFLRLRAVQKLLAYHESCLEQLKDTTEIDEDMRFLVFAANQLIKKDALFSDEDTLRLDKLTTKKFGKPIIPFIFEEMIVAWEKNRQVLEGEWESENKLLAKDKLFRNRLLRAQKYEELSSDESEMLKLLTNSIPQNEKKLDVLQDNLFARRCYVNAAEGFLQMLEKDEQSLIDEGREYLLEQGAEVGRLLIDCSQNNREWNSLSAQEQSLINDFSNIFSEDSQARTSLALVEVTV